MPNRLSKGAAWSARAAGVIVLSAWQLPYSFAAGPEATNIFTPPPQEEAIVPTFKESAADETRRAFLGGQKGDGFSQFNRLRNIPSLTPQQRKQIVQIFTAARSQADPLRQQIQNLVQKYKGDRQQVLSDPELKDQFLDLRRQVHDLQVQVNEQVHQVITPQQEQELEAMRKGELMPSTFNEPQSGLPQMLRARAGQSGGPAFFPSAPRRNNELAEPFPGDQPGMRNERADNSNSMPRQDN